MIVGVVLLVVEEGGCHGQVSGVKTRAIGREGGGEEGGWMVFKAGRLVSFRCGDEPCSSGVETGV